MSRLKGCINLLRSFLFDSHQMAVVGILCLLAECALNLFIVEKVSYTEIDWQAYMSEVEGFLNGTTDYTELKGGTGPLVYPAGFVYFFSGLYYVTDQGKNVKLAQYIFAGFYLMMYALIIQIMKKSEAIPPFILLFFTFASYRIHSIFALRLFNDPIAMIFLYIAVLFFMEKKWLAGCTLFSVAVSIKMNVMLFSPGLLFILLVECGLVRSVLYISWCGLIQLAAGAPFLTTNPTGYIKMSFDLGRQFFFEWTVNWRFLPENIFLSRYFHVMLLAIHIGLLTAICLLKWRKFLLPLSRKSILIILFSSNFIGICCARSLHYQFYVWYYHTIPALLFSTNLPQPVIMLVLGLVEMCWNTFPSTNMSSGMLQLCHLVGLTALLMPSDKLKLA